MLSAVNTPFAVIAVGILWFCLGVAAWRNNASVTDPTPCTTIGWADRVGVLIDVTREHTSPVLRVAFGTHGMQAVDPCDASYGVQAVSVYVR